MKLRSRLANALCSPRTWVWLHGSLVALWILLIPPSITWWRDSVPYLVAISVLANVFGSMASLQAARADLNSPDAADIARLEKKIDALRGRVNMLVVRGR